MFTKIKALFSRKPAPVAELSWADECERRATAFGWDAEELAFQKAAFDLPALRMPITHLSGTWQKVKA